MAYFDRPTFAEDPTSLSGLACGPDCSCAGCRDRAAGLGSGLGCGSGCSCQSCRDVTARLGERYVPEPDDDDDDDDGPEDRAPATPAAGEPAGARAAARPGPRARRSRLPATRHRSGLSEWGGYAGWGYGEAAGAPRVVFIPGIMGSALSATLGGGRIPVIGRTAPSATLPVWGTNAMIAALSSAAALGAWRAAMGSGDGIANGGAIAPTGLTLINLPAGRTIDPYSAIMRDLNAAFGAANVMEFPYDWRLANEHNATRLRAAILQRWPDATTNRVTLLCHSMGGLVARALVETLGGTTIVSRVVTAGTPHFGAPEALVTLTNAGVSTFTANFFGPLGMLGSAVATVFTGMVRNYGGLMQLLPGFDCLTPRGAAGVEPISRTYVRIRTDPFWQPVFGGSLMRSPATTSIRALNRALNGGVATLNSRLAAGRVRYDTIASINIETTVGVREIAGSVVSPVTARCGDGAVPVTSGALPAGSNISPLFVSTTRVHNDLFNDPAVRSLCVGLIRGTSTSSPVAQPGCATIPATRTGLEGPGLGCGACLSAQLREAGISI